MFTCQEPFVGIVCRDDQRLLVDDFDHASSFYRYISTPYTPLLQVANLPAGLVSCLSSVSCGGESSSGRVGSRDHSGDG